MYVQRVKDILTEEFINPFPNEMDKTKLYNITSGTYTSNDISECLLTIFERGKIRMVEFNESISKNASNNYIFDRIKREKWKTFEDTVKRTAKTKIDGKIKDIVEQKISLGYLQQNQIKVNELSILKMPCPSHLSLFLYLLLQQMVRCEKQKHLIYMMQLILSQITTYYWKITLVSTIYLAM